MKKKREHLIVELKAPTVKIGMQETGQVKSNAFAVHKDERFRGVPTRWNFWVVSNDMDGMRSERFASRTNQRACCGTATTNQLPDLG